MVTSHGCRIHKQDKEYTLIREDDLIGILPRSGATAADIPELKPLSDRVLLQVGSLF